MRWLLVICLLISTAFNVAIDKKKNYPQNFFRPPVGNTLRLSGTFGELRPNHFHAGIDIKARDGKVGQPVYAAGEGFISRIKLQSGGYGKVLYLSHPNGYSSVYAHLDRFSPEIENFVKTTQYEKKSFEVELFPRPDQFPIAKGQEIGKLGISGRSFGPHLHFEIRDSRTEKPINPLLFGIPVEDSRPPRLHELKTYFLNDKLETIDTRTNKLIHRGGTNYSVSNDTLSLGAWRVGFGLKAYDLMNGVSNWNGVYSVEMYQDDSLVYQFEMESFSFDETRFINAHLDYEEQVTKKSYFNRCYALPGNKLSLYNRQINDGVIQLHKNQASKIEMIAYDFEGNEARLKFWVKRAPVKEHTPSETYNYILPYDEENIIRNNAFMARFPKGAFYENLYLKYYSSSEQSAGYYSSVHHIHDYKTPVHYYFKISIRPDPIPAELRSKAFIAYCDQDNKITNCGGRWENEMISTSVRDLGDYCIMIDDVAPTITPVIFKNDMRGMSQMSFKITDNFETGARARGLRYRATVDGQWVLMEYDAKNDRLTHWFDGKISPGKHQLVLEVWDNRDNKASLERTFLK